MDIERNKIDTKAKQRRTAWTLVLKRNTITHSPDPATETIQKENGRTAGGTAKALPRPTPLVGADTEEPASSAGGCSLMISSDVSSRPVRRKEMRCSWKERVKSRYVVNMGGRQCGGMSGLQAPTSGLCLAYSGLVHMLTRVSSWGNATTATRTPVGLVMRGAGSAIAGTKGHMGTGVGD